MRGNRIGFTLVELLVVIAIISVLAAMLMPALSDALEQGRRVVCANNERQLHLCWMNYAADYNDHMPPYEWNGNRSSCVWVPQTRMANTASGVRVFFNNYVGIPISLTVSTDNFHDMNNVAFCPAHNPAFNDSPTFNNGQVKFYGWFSYVFDAVGHFREPLGGIGTPKVERMARGGPLGKVLFMQDEVKGHNGIGCNAQAVDGSVRWQDYYKCSTASHTSFCWQFAQGFYQTTTVQPEVSPGAWSFSLFFDHDHYLYGVSNPSQALANRRMYGYAQ